MSNLCDSKDGQMESGTNLSRLPRESLREAGDRQMVQSWLLVDLSWVNLI